MKYELKTYNINTPDQELLDDIKKVAIRLGKKKMTIFEYNEKGKFHSSTLIRRFGGWNKALEKADLQKVKNHNISDEELFENIEEVWVKLGRQPHNKEMTPPISNYGANTYVRRFGTWMKALELFIQYVNNEEILTEKLLETKKEISSKHKTKREINWRLRFLVLRRDNYKCISCGHFPATHLNVQLHVDHIISWDKGGETVYENLQALCIECNLGKSNLDYGTK